MLVADFRVQPEQFGPLEGLDERHGVADSRQQDVTAGLVRFGFDGEPDVVSLVGDVVAEHVEGFAVTLESTADVFGCVVFRALTSAPHDEGLRTQLDTELELAHGLAHGVAAHSAIIGGESTVFEDGSAEQVGGDHRHNEAGVGEGLLEAADLCVALGVGRPERVEVVVVEGEAVCAEFRELLDGVYDIEGSAGGPTEGVCSVVSDRPEAERELVVAGGNGHGCSFAVDQKCCSTQPIAQTGPGQSVRSASR